MRGRHGTLAAQIALTVIAICVLDAAFVQRPPGTAAADHLASGLVPAGTAAALVLVWPRLRPGAQAVAALVCGALAITAGIAAGDTPARLAAAAGAVLIGLGAVTLWRTRRLDERRPRRYARRALIAAAAAVVAFLVVLPVGVAIVATHRARAHVGRPDLGRPYARVSLRTTDGLRLAGFYVPSRNRAAVIAFPGTTGPVPEARMLARHGYGVLLLDRRGEGESQGDFNAYGWGGEADLAAALAFLRRRPDVDPRRIGGLGLSVGGELLLQTAAHHPSLRAVVSEGAGVRSLREHLHTPGLGALQRWVSPWVVQTAALAVLGDAPPPPDLTGLVGRIAPRPILLISAAHGHEDEALNRVYLRAAGRPKRAWVVSAGGHTGALAARPAEYRRLVLGFFAGALLGPRPPAGQAGGTGRAGSSTPRTPRTARSTSMLTGVRSALGRTSGARGAPARIVR